MNTIKKYTIYVLVAVLLAGAGLLKYYQAQAEKYRTENAVLTNNAYAYQQESLYTIDSLKQEKGIFEFTVKQLSESRDSIVQELNKARKKLGIKDKELKELNYFKASIVLDTAINVTNIITEDCQFNIDLNFNPLTRVSIANTKVDSLEYVLTYVADISGSFKGFIYTKTNWVEPNWFKRLVLFRWGKQTTERALLESDNEYIKVNDFKVIRKRD